MCVSSKSVKIRKIAKCPCAFCAYVIGVSERYFALAMFLMQLSFGKAVHCAKQSTHRSYAWCAPRPLYVPELTLRCC